MIQLEDCDEDGMQSQPTKKDDVSTIDPLAENSTPATSSTLWIHGRKGREGTADTPWSSYPKRHFRRYNWIHRANIIHGYQWISILCFMNRTNYIHLSQLLILSMIDHKGRSVDSVDPCPPCFFCVKKP